MVKKSPRSTVFPITGCNQHGQVLLVIVLLMVIILTIGLSLAGRSITNVRQASDTDNSQRAFSAAEAGVQVALKTDKSVSKTNFSDTTTYVTDVKTVRPQQMNIREGTQIFKDESVELGQQFG
jgi:Tfp pilus assembly protein PilX